MDSQQQYEALLAKWGYVDTTLEDHARKQKRTRRVKAVVAFFLGTVKNLKKASARPQILGQTAN
ncbi:hypothetical protein [Marinomonas sp. IMCC 4694]|uniref:hypothetical protein n=1 Tax=Marinomonas sp. IMCC 4694 TaxID=2605432 RepID=UPI0011E7C464|nr:hypothetical protein [Marinomonas sp. IMCC 4694]TYL48140.1 hypothetical protein FXV75_09440 [Marinomonas sp. IMCC 4694]